MRRRKSVHQGARLTIALLVHKTFNQVVGEMPSLMIVRLALAIHLCYKATDSHLDAHYATGIIIPDGNQASTHFEMDCSMAELVGTSSAYR
jgi:hypothetical protein